MIDCMIQFVDQYGYIIFFLAFCLGPFGIPIPNEINFLKAEHLFKKHGSIAMGIGFFIPVIRYMMPLFVGLSKIPYKRFAFISYSSALVWTIIFFTFGFHIINLFAALDAKIILLALLLASSLTTYKITKYRLKLLHSPMHRPSNK